MAMSTEDLAEALVTRLRHVDLVAWAHITARAEELGLSFEHLRLLLALTTRDGASSVSDLARISALPLEATYPELHDLRRRGYLHEERRRYSLTEEGHELIAIMDAAHRQGIQAYVEGLDASEREWLDQAVRMTRDLGPD